MVRAIVRVMFLYEEQPPFIGLLGFGKDGKEWIVNNFLSTRSFSRPPIRIVPSIVRSLSWPLDVRSAVIITFGLRTLVSPPKSPLRGTYVRPSADGRNGACGRRSRLRRVRGIV